MLLDKAAYFLLLACVIWAPWPLGSNRPWAVALIGALLCCGLLLALFARLFARRPETFAAQPATLWWVPGLSLAGFALVLCVQMLPSAIAPATLLSIDPFQTRRYLFTTLTYAAAWGLVLLSVTSATRAKRLLAAVAMAGVLQAAAAIVLSSTDWKYQLLFAEFDQRGRAVGTFVNLDHLAGYMELTLSAGLGWLVMQFRQSDSRRGPGWQAGLSSALNFFLSPKMLLRLLLVVMVIALVMTHSRAGNAAFFLALFAVGAAVAVQSRRLRKTAVWLVLSMALIDMLIIGQWVGIDRVVQRLRDTAEASLQGAAAPTTAAPVAYGTATPVKKPPSEQSLQERLQVPTQSLSLVAARPWLGYGGGTYALAFPQYKAEPLDGLLLHWNQAHNDFVQVAAETGVLGFALWLAVGVLTAWRSLKTLPDRERSTRRGLGVAALMAMCCMALHGMVDFNLQIPANALTFTVLLAAVWTGAEKAQSTRATRRKTEGIDRPEEER